jgi:hypothetical protein
MLPVDQPRAGALFVAAEKWPVPYPRVLSNGIVLGDAAVALWIVRAGDMPGLQVIGHALHSCDPCLDFRQLIELATEAVSCCLRSNCVDKGDVSGWICSGLDACLDHEVRRRLELVPALIAGRNEPGGYLSAAAIPIGISEILEHPQGGRGRRDGVIVALGVSFGGSIGVLLLRPVDGAQRC